jgi:O-antigen/teichoic acid export membrane protein
MGELGGRTMADQKDKLYFDSKRVAINTLMLYIRQIIIMLISLYTVRVVLNVLGIEDYGIYNVVAGIVALFSFLSSSMVTASQRFFSYAMGKKDDMLLERTFSLTFTVYIILSVGVLILAETIGLWYLRTQLVIPNGRMLATLWVYQFAMISFAITMLTTPYMSSIIAHENMSIYAYVSIVEASLKLAIVYLLRTIHYDKLIVYSALLMVVSVIITSIYRAYCRKKYFECKIRLIWDSILFREAFTFTGWTLFGSFTTILRTQVITIMLNQVFGAIVVSARSISINVANYVNIFSSNFNIGLYPSIIKEYASGRKNNMYTLVFNGSKLTFYLMWVFTLPMYIHMDYILKIWLGSPVEGAILFTRLALIESLINSITLPVTTAARAPGQMKQYESILGILQILIFVISFIMLKLGGGAETVYYVAILVNIIMVLVRLMLVDKLTGLSLTMFLIRVLLPIIGMVIISSIPTIFAYIYMPKTFIYRFLNVLLGVSISSLYMYFFGIEATLRQSIKDYLKGRLKRLSMS